MKRRAIAFTLAIASGFYLGSAWTCRQIDDIRGEQ